MLPGRPALMLACAAALLLAPSLILGTLQSQSAPQNFTWAAQFAEQFRAGILYPRWMPEVVRRPGRARLLLLSAAGLLARRRRERRHLQPAVGIASAGARRLAAVVGVGPRHARLARGRDRPSAHRLLGRARLHGGAVSPAGRSLHPGRLRRGRGLRASAAGHAGHPADERPAPLRAARTGAGLRRLAAVAPADGAAGVDHGAAGLRDLPHPRRRAAAAVAAAAPSGSAWRRSISGRRQRCRAGSRPTCCGPASIASTTGSSSRPDAGPNPSSCGSSPPSRWLR